MTILHLMAPHACVDAALNERPQVAAPSRAAKARQGDRVNEEVIQ
jgi:hypothetical protein